MNNSRRLLFLAILFGLATLLTVTAFAQQNPDGTDSRYVGRIPAPEFPQGLDWLNVENPLTMDGLRGKIVLLDFWTYGCINCIHQIPVLEQVKEKYAEEIVVIGVHSAKFSNEGQTENLREIVQRYGLDHPVINDRDFRVWESYGAQAWPTFAIVDPRGNVVAAQAGEVPFEAFDTYFSNMIEYYDNLGEDDLDRTPIELALEGAGDPGTPLLYPGNVLADVEGNRLFIADSSHHRIVIADLTTYEVLATIGNGTRGYADGNYAEARFDSPQGMELDGGTLYIADVNNHALRAVDLESETVTTIAGTGRMGRGIASFDTVVQEPLEYDLRSPWDVVRGPGDLLYFSMAGTHQIWEYDLAETGMTAVIGNGREAQLSTDFPNSQLAQPSGLYYTGFDLYFADSESSTIRVGDVVEQTVRVASGTIDNNLFDYGDADGPPGESRLQHALSVTGDGEVVYIADTYNDKLRVYDPETEITTTLAGADAGYRDGSLDEARFHEPGGVYYADDKLYIADTNNHAIRVLDLTNETVDTVQFPNPQALVIEREDRAVTLLGGNVADNLEITYDVQIVAPGNGAFELLLGIPDGYKINPLTDSFIDVRTNADNIAVVDEQVVIESDVVRVPLAFQLAAIPEAAEDEAEATPEVSEPTPSEVTLAVTLFYCEAENEAFCLIDEATLIVPVVVDATADTSTATFGREITLPEGL